jgi:hypothetical protein
LPELGELTVLGYGFGDNHINFRISNALLLNPELRVRIFDPVRFGSPDCLELFDYNNKVRGAYCGAAKWMYYSKHQTWNGAQIEALKKSNHESVKKRVYDFQKQMLSI